MSISSAMSNALSGLRAAGRMADATSDNLANALTPEFARREIALSSVSLNGFGSGVRVVGVERAIDLVATRSRREAETASAEQDVVAAAHSQALLAFGDPSSSGSLNAKMVAFENAIISAANEPSSTIHLEDAVRRASELSDKFNQVSDAISTIRKDADAAIEAQVETLNSSLAEIKKINVEIRARALGSEDTSALVDRRGTLIDKIAEIVPVNVVQRDYGQISLFTPSGGILLDEAIGTASFSFTPTPVISPGMTLGAPLSGLSVNGNAVAIGAGTGYFDGGSLSANFVVRDQTMTDLHGQLDGLARDVVERLQDPAVDPTLTATDAGLFTDGGTAFAAANEVGLASRISINAAVDANAGGAAWRLRDGLNAVAPGLAGDNTILRAIEGALGTPRTPVASIGISQSSSASGFIGAVNSQLAERTASEESLGAFAATELAVLREAESSRVGVDSDAELQNLLQIEKFYAANARVIETIDTLLDRLLR